MFAQSNSWYGRSTANLGRNSDRWSEGYLAPGFGLTYELGGAGRVNGAFNLVGPSPAARTRPAAMSATRRRRMRR